MSDRPEDLELELRDVIIALTDVGGREWYDLGLQLHLSPSTLDTIAAHPNVEDHKLMMLKKWLHQDPDASWEKLASALTLIGHKATAASVRNQFVSTANVDVNVRIKDEDHETRIQMTKTALETIKRDFSCLLVDVRVALQALQVDIVDIHQFLVSFFQRDDCIPKSSDLTAIFNAISVAKLWNYDHYGPLKRLAESFLPEDNPARKRVTDYRSQLSGFFMTTKIIDFIDLSDSEDHPQQDFSPEKYKPHYRKLTLTLKLNRKVKLSDLTLKYVDTLWKALIEEFNLPPLTVVIDKIVRGSLIVSWLIPQEVATVILDSYSKAIRFYEQQTIIQVKIDEKVLYDQNWIEHSTPLYKASFMGDTDEVRDLLMEGASVHLQNNDWRKDTALIGACQSGQAATARVLLEHGAIADYQNSDGKTALWYASCGGHSEAVKVLLEYGAHVSLPNEDGWGNNPLIGACQEGNAETAQILLDHGAIADYKNKSGETALTVACSQGMPSAVTVLLRAGARTDIQDLWGYTGLMLASHEGYADIVEQLLVAKADPNITDENEETALFKAAKANHISVVKLLLDNGAIMDLRNKDGESALSTAACEGSVNIVKILLDYRADVDLSNKDGETALIKACYHKQPEIVSVLLKGGANADIQDKDGWTAIYNAALAGNSNIVKVLIDHGAKVDLRDTDGLTALDVAQASNHQAVCEILEQHATYQATRTKLTEEQKSKIKLSIGKRILKMVEKTLLKQKVKKREQQIRIKEYLHNQKQVTIPNIRRRRGDTVTKDQNAKNID